MDSFSKDYAVVKKNMHFVGRHKIPIPVMTLTYASTFGLKSAAITHLLGEVYGKSMFANKSWSCFTQVEQAKIGDITRKFTLNIPISFSMISSNSIMCLVFSICRSFHRLFYDVGSSRQEVAEEQ